MTRLPLMPPPFFWESSPNRLVVEPVFTVAGLALRLRTVFGAVSPLAAPPATPRSTAIATTTADNTASTPAVGLLLINALNAISSLICSGCPLRPGDLSDGKSTTAPGGYIARITYLSLAQLV